jgi:hypothetical protein
MTMSAGGEARSVKGKGGDDASWTDANTIVPKKEENPSGQFSCYKRMVNI